MQQFPSKVLLSLLLAGAWHWCRRSAHGQGMCWIPLGHRGSWSVALEPVLLVCSFCLVVQDCFTCLFVCFFPQLTTGRVAGFLNSFSYDSPQEVLKLPLREKKLNAFILLGRE